MTNKEETTANKILSAAQKLFVENGFAGTSMGKIAAAAQVNHSLIFHHFGNKQKLWLAVKQNILCQAEDSKKILPDTNLAFETFLAALFRQKIHFYRSNPDIVRMFNWQRLESEESQIGLSMTAGAKAWIDALGEYQKKGDIDKNIKLEFLLSFLLALISSAALDPNSFITGEKNQEAYIDFCVARIIAAVKPH